MLILSSEVQGKGILKPTGKGLLCRRVTTYLEPRRRSHFAAKTFHICRAFTSRRFAFILLMAAAASSLLHAQDNYEIQIYGSETVAPQTLMVETHSNFSAVGSKALPGSKFTSEGTYPTNHAERETLELTTGINRWSELGFYLFSSSSSATGVQWVGDHLRPRVRAPESWHWPVGASLSMEIGYQRAVFSPDTWTWEIRPIIDKQIGRWYASVNPAMERAFHGPGIRDGLSFTPGFQIGYDFTKVVTGNIEYYGSYGKLGDFVPLRDQQQQIFPTIDLNVSPAWEINFGVGVGMTSSTDHIIVKAIIGRRFNWSGRRLRGSSKDDQDKPQNP
jgi:hypothetical protein